MTASPEFPRARLPRLHVVTDDDVLCRSEFLSTAREILEAGGSGLTLHIRSRSLSGAVLFSLASSCVHVAKRTGSWILINDRIDIALAAGATGVQLGQSSFSASEARGIAPDLRLGVSIHAPEEAWTASKKGADFLLAGTLFGTASHPDRPGQGTAWIAEAAAADLPVIGIGGVGVERVAEVLHAGAYGVATIRAIWDALSPAAAVSAFLEELESSR